MIEEYASLISAKMDVDEGDAELMLKECQELYETIQALKGKHCPMALSIAMASQIFHINTGDVYGGKSLVDGLIDGTHWDLSYAVANIDSDE